MAIADRVPEAATTPGPPRTRRRHGVVFWCAVAWLVLIGVFAAFAEWLPVADPEMLSVEAMLQPPSGEHLLGTDGTGRDILARIVHGARVSVVVSLAAVSVGLVVGGTLGIVVGFFRGRAETFVMAAVDVILAFPGLVLLLALVAFVGQSLVAISLVIGFLSIPVYARVARANTLSVAQREFVLAARAMGAKPLRLLVSEVLPNVVLPLLAYALVATGVIVILEGSLAFLGLSVPPPAPTWGSMIAEGKRHLETSPHVAAIPAVVMFLTVLSLNLVGDRLRGRFDVREANV
ncbi:ABC transporter permease [Pseudonocardia kunmingensis]|uniref:Peptide/nickel transport system permease protein n=1 Tax=Pseudonocardia kunmingensis TaxID=630975 RepID=A0A543DRK3_9PSEU|nr:ABC transporter permease [Pseudonocardia kunmingensis]TQM11942.1 peptide/nickel transport system permease protein [Pseudonocardia kunmingensis]